MSFKNRGREKEYRGKGMNEIKHTPSMAWVKGKFVVTKRYDP